jgi:rRNA maturation RNase YbeY
LIQIQIETDPLFSPPNQEICESIIHSICAKHQIQDLALTLIFAQDDLLTNLKKEFFKLDQFTDVIAFRLNEYDEKNVEGEIYISLPRAKENAVTFDEQFEKETSRLIIHGCLHLLGFNDETSDEKREMTNMEDNFLSQINWQNLFEKIEK